MNIVKYLFDSSRSASIHDLNEFDDFEQECSMQGFFISLLQQQSPDIRVWFKPEKWIQQYFGFTDKQIKGVFILARLAWSGKRLKVIDMMNDYDFHKLNKKQRKFLRQMLDGSNGFQENIDLEIF